MSSMLIISNLLPIDLKAIELSAQRYLSFDKSNFTPSSLKAIGTFLPDLKSTNSRAECVGVSFRSYQRLQDEHAESLNKLGLGGSSQI